MDSIVKSNSNMLKRLSNPHIIPLSVAKEVDYIKEKLICSLVVDVKGMVSIPTELW